LKVDRTLICLFVEGLFADVLTKTQSRAEILEAPM